GGAGGAFAMGTLSVQAGMAVPVTVGTGGSGGSTEASGGAGDSSAVGTGPLILAQGGAGGLYRLRAGDGPLAQGGQARLCRGKMTRSGGSSGPGFIGAPQAGVGGG